MGALVPRLWLCALLASGCAIASGGEASDVSAQGMYKVAEQHYAREDFPAAAVMMKHAIVNLPETKDHDHLRHALILRMAHTQLRAFHTTGDSAFLVDAQTMLYRYLAKHEALFGGGDKAKADRGECYELLYEVESRLDAVAAAPSDALVSDIEAAVRVANPASGGATPAEAAPSAGPPRDSETNDAKPPTMEDDAGDPAAGPAASVSTESSDNGEIEMIDGSPHRRVHVRSPRRPDVNDPVTREKLRSDFSLPWAGFVLTRGGGQAKLHGPRPLVRMAGLARAVTGPPSFAQATALAHRFVAGARVDLRACYDQAFARRPVGATEATIELTVDKRGHVHKPRIVGGRVVDGIGDVCVIQVAALARVSDPPEYAMRVRVPLVFFYEGAVFVREPIVSTSGAQYEMPAIDARNGPTR